MLFFIVDTHFSQHNVQKPKNRTPLYKWAAREYFILKRRWHWWFSATKYARKKQPQALEYSVVKHKSFLLRQLKNVDMYLQHNKTQNLRLAISKVNGIVLQPNETLSLWKLIGRPTKGKGYKDGLVLSNGKIGKGTGGGLCQLGNLMYWMALHTPLTVVERWRHSYDVFPDSNRKIPFGSGATLSYNYVDLQLKNNTPYPYQILLWLDDEYLNGEIRCAQPAATTYQVYESEHFFKQQWWGGYTRHNKIMRKAKKTETGNETEELVTENHAIMMYNPMLEG